MIHKLQRPDRAEMNTIFDPSGENCRLISQCDQEMRNGNASSESRRQIWHPARDVEKANRPLPGDVAMSRPTGPMVGIGRGRASRDATVRITI